MKDKSVDATITDPPYNLGIDYGETTDDDRSDYSEWCETWLSELERISRTIAITCGVANLGMWVTIKPPSWILCWHKSFSVSHGAFGFSNWEPVLIYGETGKHERQSDYFHATFIKEKSAIGHPCPKPIKWASQICKIVSSDGDTIFDPFMGSGTTGVACMQLGRNFIGCEINPDYYAIAEKRIKQAASQLIMPLSTPAQQRHAGDGATAPVVQSELFAEGNSGSDVVGVTRPAPDA